MTDKLHGNNDFSGIVCGTVAVMHTAHTHTHANLCNLIASKPSKLG